MSNSGQYLQDIIGLHQEEHQRLREAITDLDSEGLNWTPGPDTSSIGTIIVHALGAEAEMLRNILQIPTNRNRDAEFSPQTHELGNLLRLLDTADDDWQQLAPRVQENDLRALLPRPNKSDPQSGLFWLVRNYGHIREHRAQIQLTKQLHKSRG